MSDVWQPEAVLQKYDTIFIDSITVAGRLCFTHNQNQPEARSDRTGKLTLAQCTAHKVAMMAWLTHLQTFAIRMSSLLAS